MSAKCRKQRKEGKHGGAIWNEVVLLADSSKFDQTAFVKLMDLKRLDYIITDKRPEDVWLEYCEENGIRLIY